MNGSWQPDLQLSTKPKLDILGIAMPGDETPSSTRPRPCRRAPARTIALKGCEVTLLPAVAYDVRYVPAAAVIGFAFEAQAGVHAFASDRAQPFRTRPNSTAYIPAGCEVASRSPDGGEYLTIRVDQSNNHAGFPDRRFNDRIDRQAIAAAQNLRRMILSGVFIDTLDVEREISALVESVVRADPSSGEAIAARWMTDRRLRLVDAGMSRDLMVDDIAGHLGLSSGFLNRAFKAAIGKTPHDYVLDRRVSRARGLITRSDMSLASIAAACGFASQAHMTTLFRRRVGITPGALRARS
ncbi:MAG: helix-turn-helix transcriptional regulator [Xanthobacteraceae bacterium]